MTFPAYLDSLMIAGVRSDIHLIMKANATFAKRTQSEPYIDSFIESLFTAIDAQFSKLAVQKESRQFNDIFRVQQGKTYLTGTSIS